MMQHMWLMFVCISYHQKENADCLHVFLLLLLFSKLYYADIKFRLNSIFDISIKV